MSKLPACACRAVVLCCALWWAATAAAGVALRGVDEDTEAVLRAFVALDDLSCDAPRWWVERRHRQAPGEIRRGMEVLGYYRAEVSASLEWPHDGCWEAVYRVAPGEPVRVQEFDLEITGPLAGERRLERTLEVLELGPEEAFSHQAYERMKTRLLETAESLGYFDAEFTRRRVEVNPESNLADIELTLTGGQRYRIGAVEIDQTVLDDELFRRFLRFSAGEPYDAEALTHTYRNLLESDFFDRCWWRRIWTSGPRAG